MLNYTQITNIINIIKEDLHIKNLEPKKIKSLCEGIYIYVNQTGCYYPIPKNLSCYKNILSLFRDPINILAYIRKDFPVNTFFDEEKIKKEIQTIALLWLHEAIKKPIHNIDLYTIINQYNTTIH